MFQAHSHINAVHWCGHPVFLFANSRSSLSCAHMLPKTQNSRLIQDTIVLQTGIYPESKQSGLIWDSFKIPGQNMTWAKSMNLYEKCMRNVWDMYEGRMWTSSELETKQVVSFWFSFWFKSFEFTCSWRTDRATAAQTQNWQSIMSNETSLWFSRRPWIF